MGPGYWPIGEARMTTTAGKMPAFLYPDREEVSRHPAWRRGPGKWLSGEAWMTTTAGKMPAFLYPGRGRGIQASCLEKGSGTVEYRGRLIDHFCRQDACIPIPAAGKMPAFLFPLPRHLFTHLISLIFSFLIVKNPLSLLPSV